MKRIIVSFCIVNFLFVFSMGNNASASTVQTPISKQATPPAPITLAEYNSLSYSSDTGKLGEIRCGDTDPMIIVLAVLGALVLIAACVANNQKTTTQ